MRELIDIVRAWRTADESARMVLITVVDIKGSTYRRPGARLLIVDQQPYGSISGGCLESELTQTSYDRTENGPTLAVFDTTSDEDAVWGFGLGCRGVVTVLLRRVNQSDPEMRLLAAHLDRREPTHFAIHLDGREIGSLADYPATDSQVTPSIVNRDTGSLFVENLAPRTALRIYGAGFDAQPLAKIANVLGWHATVYDFRANLVTKERFPAADKIVCEPFENLASSSDRFAAGVIMSHNYERDRTILAKLLNSDLGYLGVLGPRARTDRLLEELGRSEDLCRLYSPIGLDVGAETPQEIALAIIAEIQTVFSSRAGGFLRDRPKSLHRAVALTH